MAPGRSRNGRCDLITRRAPEQWRAAGKYWHKIPMVRQTDDSFTLEADELDATLLTLASMLRPVEH